MTAGLVLQAQPAVSPVRDERQELESMKLLALAAAKGNDQFVADLMDTLPPAVSALVPIDQTPLWQAIQSGNTSVATRLVKWQTPDPRRDDGG
jgi:hypothetical protein